MRTLTGDYPQAHRSSFETTGQMHFAANTCAVRQCGVSPIFTNWFKNPRTSAKFAVETVFSSLELASTKDVDNHQDAHP